MRSAPSGGYDFSRKRDYRRKVWATFRDGLKRLGHPVRSSHAILMPSLEGDEIEVALNAGFLEEHLHVIDSEPAIVATLKRRYRRVNTYGVRASRAADRIAKSGAKIRCANFDLCNKVSDEFVSELKKVMLRGHFGTTTDDRLIASEGFLADQAFVAVSVFRGRESRRTTELMRGWEELTSDPAALFEREFDDRTLDGIEPAAAAELKARLKARFVGGSFYKHTSSLGLLDRQRLLQVQLVLCCGTLKLDQSLKPLVEMVRAEHYPNVSGKTMLWSVYEVTSARHVYETTAAWALP